MSEFSIERITELTPEVLKAISKLAPQLESPSQVTLNKEYLERLVANPDCHLLMARRNQDSNLVGMAILYILPFATNIRTTLENIIVDRDAGIENVDVALCVRAQEIAKEQGANGIRTQAYRGKQSEKAMMKKAGIPTDNAMDHYERWLSRGPRF